MKRTSVLLLGILLFTSAAFAQMGPPKPGPELKKLDYFLGTWTSEGESKPSPMGPGGKFTESGHGEWMDGGFFLVVTPTLRAAPWAMPPGLPTWATTPTKRSIPTTNSTPW